MKFMLKSLIIILSLGVFNLYGSDKDKKAKAAPKAESKVTTASSSPSSSSPKSEKEKKKSASKAKKKKKKKKVDSNEIIDAILKNRVDEAIKLIESNKINLEVKDGHGNTALILAAEHGGEHCEVVKFLIKHKANIDVKNKYGSTALIVAAYFGNFEIVKFLLDKGADINLQSENKETALFRACEKGHENIVELLIKRGANLDIRYANNATALNFFVKRSNIGKLLIDHGADINIPHDNGVTPLMVASSFAEGYEIVKHLLKQPKIKIDLQSKSGNTALIFAAKHGHSDIIKLLKNNGADETIKDDKGKTYKDYLKPSSPSTSSSSSSPSSSSPKPKEEKKESDSKAKKKKKEFTSSTHTNKLFDAINNERIKEAIELIKSNKINLEEKDKNGSTVLIVAADLKMYEIVKLLLEHKANINAQNIHGNTALFYASCKGQDKEYYKIAELLINSGADLNIQNEHGDSALFSACYFGCFDAAKLLIRYGANVNIQNIDGNTALFFTSDNTQECYEVAELLINNGANVNIQNEHGDSALFNVCNFGCFHIANLLISNGIDVNIKNKDGNSALFFTFNKTEQRYEIAELLINNGIDVNIQNELGESALICACNYGCDNIAKLLIQNDANVNLQNKYGETALSSLHEYFEYDTVDLLIKKGAAVNIVNRNGDTPLILSIATECFGASALLLHEGADVNMPNKNGDTPLIFASIHTHDEIVEEVEALLSQPGININAQNKAGCTALMCAVAKKNPNTFEIVELLLKNNANVHIKDKDGKTALDFASKPKIRKLLIEHGAEKIIPLGMPAPENKDEQNLFDKLKELETAFDKTTNFDRSTEDLFLNYRKALIEAKIAFGKISRSSKMYPASDLLINSYESSRNKDSQKYLSTLFKKLKDSLNKLKLKESEIKVKKEIFDECNNILKEIRNTDKTQKIAATLKIEEKLTKIERDLRKKVCANCYSFEKLNRCTACNQVRYCSTECQKEDWKNHKTKCTKKIKDSESKEEKEEIEQVEEQDEVEEQEQTEEESKTEKDNSESNKDTDSESKEEKESPPTTENDDDDSESKLEADLSDDNEKNEDLEKQLIQLALVESLDLGKSVYRLEKEVENLISKTFVKQIKELPDLEKSNVLKWLHLRIEELDIENARKYSDEFDEKATDVLAQLNSILKSANEAVRNLIKHLTLTIKDNIDAYVEIYEYIYISLKNEKLKDKLFTPDNIKSIAHYYEKALENMAIELSKSSTSDISSSSTSLSSRSETESKESSYVFKPTKKCIACSKSGTKVCAGCRKVHYCSTDCQTKDWENHKLAHALFKNASSLPLRLTYKPDLQDPK